MQTLSISESWKDKKVATVLYNLPARLSFYHIFYFFQVSFIFLPLLFLVMASSLLKILWLVIPMELFTLTLELLEKVLCNHTQNMKERYPLWEIPRPPRLKCMIYKVLCLSQNTNTQKSTTHQLFKSKSYSSRILPGTIIEIPCASFYKQYIKAN